MPMPRKPDPLKHCQHCGTLLERKHYNGALEDYRTFLRRKYCSLSCSAQDQTDRGASCPMREVTRSAYHERARRVIDLRTAQCECCGMQAAPLPAIRTGLSLHHVSEDFRDNRPENLQVLCNACHNLWHTLHRRLGVPTSMRMPELSRFLRLTSPDGWLS